MRDPNEIVEKILQQISDGSPVDWDTLESDPSSESLRTLLAELKVVARVAEVAGRPADARAPELLTWGHLKILSTIGSGAFGDVFRAWDSRLDREVALKIQHPRAGQAPVSTSIIEEGKLLARVRHPNVVAVYGADRLDGAVGVWMELVEGRTLAAVLLESGPLSPRETASIGVELCRALIAVHAAGLVHRDVKTQNVMREPSGRIVLMDFGAGAELRDDSSGPAGTPLYLAPELLRGKAATPQVDIYALGVLLFHLLTRDYPVRGTTLAEVRDAHDRGAGRALTDVAPTVPPALADVIQRALAADPARRYRSAADFEAALAVWLVPAPWTRRRAGARALAFLVLVVATGIWWASESSSSNNFQQRDSVVIAPFANRTADPSLNGVVEAALERELTNSGYVHVASQERIDDALRLMQKPSGTRLDPGLAMEVATRDGRVRGVVTGSIEGGREGALTITVEVIDPASESSIDHVIARQVEHSGGVGDLYVSVRRLSSAVRQQLGEPRASIRSQARLEPVSTPSLQALRLYSESYRQGSQQGPARNWAAALSLVREALSIDPNFAVAHTWHAWTLMRNHASAADVRSAAARGVERAATAPEWERHWIRGSYFFLTDDFASAAREYEQLVTLYPDHYWGVWNLNICYTRLSRYKDLVVVARAWADLRPRDTDAQLRAMDALAQSGDRRGAALYIDRTAALRAVDDPIVLRYQTWKLLIPAEEAFDQRDARGALSVATALSRTVSDRHGEARNQLIRYLAYTYLALGRPADAGNLATQLTDARVRTTLLSEIAAAAGRAAEARTLLAQRTAPGVDLAAQPGDQAFTIEAWLALRLGAARAERYVTEWNDALRGAELRIGLEGALALRLGRVKEAERKLRQFRPMPRLGAPNWYYASVMLADALVAQKREADAASVLAEVVEMSRTEPPNYASGRLWMPAQLQLARIKRRLGDERSARQLEDDLQLLLSEAEPDFPLVRELRSNWR